MCPPTSSSGTAWIAPPVSRAVETAKSPSAGEPIASDRATECGLTPDATVLLICTEGPTDPERYGVIVGSDIAEEAS